MVPNRHSAPKKSESERANQISAASTLPLSRVYTLSASMGTHIDQFLHEKRGPTKRVRRRNSRALISGGGGGLWPKNMGLLTTGWGKTRDERGKTGAVGYPKSYWHASGKSLSAKGELIEHTRERRRELMPGMGMPRHYLFPEKREVSYFTERAWEGERHKDQVHRWGDSRKG